MTPEIKPQEIESLEMKKYQEELAIKYNLPSPFQTALIKKMCTDMVESGMVPAHFNNNPMAVYLAAMRGRELELDPMESIMETFWAMPQKKYNRDTRQWEERGTVMGMYSNKMLDILHRRGVTSRFICESDERCEILFTPPKGSTHEPYTSSFSIQEAKTAELIKEGGNWFKWPRAMCRARAISIGWRSMNGVVGKGANLYSKEELEDIQYETVAPSSNGNPEVQVPKEEPAKAGKRPKDNGGKTITVQAETVTTTPAEPAKADPKPAPVETKPEPTSAPTPKPQYFVMSSESQIPPLDKVEMSKLVQFNMAAHQTADITDAMRTSDQRTKATGVSYYVLGFEGGKASVLHTSKFPDQPKPQPTPEPTAATRMYIVVSLPAIKGATTTDEITASGTHPHADLSTVSLIAQAKANDTGIPHAVLFLGENGQYEMQSQFAPPRTAGPAPVPEPAPEPAPVPAPVPEPAPQTPQAPLDEKAVRAVLRQKHDAMKDLAPTTVFYGFLQSYLDIADMKEFSKDLIAADKSLDACKKAIESDKAAFMADPKGVGTAARLRDYPPAPEPSNAEVAAMAKHYKTLGWSGQVLSMAEQYRRAVEPDVEKFKNILKYTGVEALDERNAGAFFAVANAYDRETSKKFAMSVDGKEYGDTLVKVRDKFDGARLEDISGVQFAAALDKVMSGAEDDLFGNQ